ncbi:hypothetical protein JA1_003369 [Spathaspora sp. JA1]|nr:hypothetical protein JA1_003369 [Spathaspora sp. JA1]
MDVYRKALRNPNPPKKSEPKSKPPRLPIPDIQQAQQQVVSQQTQPLSNLYTVHSAYTTRPPPPILMEHTDNTEPSTSTTTREVKERTRSGSNSSGSSSSSSRKKKNSRRKHRNSHLGCGTCKRRRIKCDESLPSCLNCLKGKLHCAYLNLDTNARNALRMAQYNQNIRQEKLNDLGFKKDDHNATQGIPTMIHHAPPPPPPPPPHMQVVPSSYGAPGQPTSLSPQYVTQTIHQGIPTMATTTAPGATPITATATTTATPSVVQSPYGPLVAVLTNTGSVVYAPTSTLSQPLQIVTTLPTANSLDQGILQQMQQQQQQQQIQQQIQAQHQLQAQQHVQAHLQQQQQQQQAQQPQQQQPSLVPITSSAASVAVKASQSIPLQSEDISLPPITNTAMSNSSSSELKLPGVKSSHSYTDVKSVLSSSSPERSPILPSLSQQLNESSSREDNNITVKLPSISTLKRGTGTTPEDEEKVPISKLIS